MSQQMSQIIITKSIQDMFNSQYQNETLSKLVHTYKGVDLANSNCHKLQNYEIFQKYAEDELHYIVDALQKGLKPHSKIGLKRLKKKNGRKKKKLRNSFRKADQLKPLIPQSPESICMKAIKNEFLQKIQQKRKTRIRQQPIKKIKSPKIIRKKLNQKMRRNQLIRLVKKYKPILQRHFGKRMIGYNGYPKVSRQQIKDYLISIGITPDIGQVKFDPEIVKLIALMLPRQAELILGKAFGIQNKC